MKVTQIHLRGVTKHTDTLVKLPSTGLVLVTGPNGGGKSSIVEAPGLVAFGKTLRGTPVWNPEAGYAVPRKRLPTCSAAVVVGGVEYTRTQTGSTGSVSWDGADKYESRREAVGALTELFGDFDAWRRAHVLSSHDGASFTGATSAQRMRLVESLAGVDSFDAAVKLGKDRAKSHKVEAATHSAKLTHLDRSISTLTSWLATQPVKPERPVEPEGYGQAPPPDPTGQLALRHADSAADLADAERAEQAHRDEQSASRYAADHWTAVHRDLTQQVTQLEQRVCPLCTQHVADPTILDRLRTEAAAAKVAAGQALEVETAAMIAADGVHRAVLTLYAETKELNLELVAARRAHDYATAQRLAEHRAHDSALAHYGTYSAQYTAHAVERVKWQRELDQAQLERAAAPAAPAPAAVKVPPAVAACAVLGVKGPRVSMLADKLAALEAATNAWLAQICANRPEQLRVELATTRTTGTGATRPEVDLRVLGVDHTEGYTGCSGGERRRLDVAFMLALAQVAEAVSGTSGGTLWGDEAFDALDAEGVDTCGALLAEMARERCVVVIAHTAAEALRPYADVHIHIEDGQIV